MENFSPFVTSIQNFIATAQTEITPTVIVVNLALAFAIGLAIAFTYQKTHVGLSYARPFVTTLVIMTVVGSVVMMIVAQNFIGAFALLGAFALIRFRTILKETRDIAFVFFALVEGVAVGMSNYTIAFITTAGIIMMIVILHRTNFGRIVHGGYLLTLIVTRPFSPEEYGPWREHIKYFSILHAKTLDPKTQEYLYDVALADPRKAHLLLHALQETAGVKHAELVSGDGAAEY